SVYLPAGKGWYDFYSGNFIEGGQVLEADAPYERMPLFVKAGSIIPIGPELQYTDEKKPSEITLYVYSGADAEFTLYEDEGTNYDYEIGKRSTIPIHYNDRNKTITIHQRSGEFNGMLKNRSFDIVFIEQD